MLLAYRRLAGITSRIASRNTPLVAAIKASSLSNLARSEPVILKSSQNIVKQQQNKALFQTRTFYTQPPPQPQPQYGSYSQQYNPYSYPQQLQQQQPYPYYGYPQQQQQQPQYGYRRVDQAGTRNNPVFIKEDRSGSLGRIVGQAIIWIIIVSGCFVVIQQMGLGASGGGGGKSTGDIGSFFGMVKQTEPVQKSNKKFSDVLGCDEAKEELVEIVEYLKNPTKFTRFGGKLPKGVLLIGEPGTGKTLLAKAVAGEAGVPFFYKTASEFDEMFVGVGARRVRELFETARKHAPCIIFIDEIDSMGRQRSVRDRSYDRMTLNQFLAEMDGFHSAEGIVVIGATNYAEGLDEALTRAGRFDKKVVVDPPDVYGRKQILDYYLSKTKINPAVSTMVVARGTPGFTGADLENLVNIAALRASMLNKEGIDMEDLDQAKDKILMGTEKKSKRVSDKNRLLTAYHEGGHALVSLLTPGTHPIHKATIVPRGRSGGMVVELPTEDHENYTLKELLARLDVMMGGRAAEELIFGEEEVTTGAYSDIKGATNLARKMVKEYGMSHLGPVNFAQDFQTHEKPSPETEKVLDQEIKQYLETAMNHAKSKLVDNMPKLHLIATALLKFETLSGEELTDLLAGKPVRGEIITLPEKPTPELVLSLTRKQKDSEPKEEGITLAPPSPPSTPGMPKPAAPTTTTTTTTTK